MTGRGDSVKDVQNNWKNVTNMLNNDNDLKEVYRFVFNFAKDEGARNLNFDMSKSIGPWGVG